MLGFPEKMRDKNTHKVVSGLGKIRKIADWTHVPMVLGATVAQASLSPRTRSGIVRGP